MDITLHKLDKIIRLQEEIRDFLIPTYRITTGTYFIPDDSTTDADPICNCHEHRSGESTAGWYCPKHGQRF